MISRTEMPCQPSSKYSGLLGEIEKITSILFQLLYFRSLCYSSFVYTLILINKKNTNYNYTQIPFFTISLLYKWDKDSLCVFTAGLFIFHSRLKPVSSKVHWHQTQNVAYSTVLNIAQISRFLTLQSLPTFHPTSASHKKISPRI